MKFIVSSTSLLKELSSISGIINNNPVIPILENFLFKIQNKKLTIIASDLQTTIYTSIPVETQEQANIAVPAKMLLDTIKNLPKQPLTFSINKETYTLEIKSENGKYKLSGENPTDFPLPQEPQEQNIEITIPAQTLKQAITQSAFATSNNDLKPAMCGIYMLIDQQGTTFVATDSNKLVKYQITDITSPQQTSLIVHKKPMNILSNQINDQQEDIKLTITNSAISYQLNNIKLNTKLINEKYPTYQNVIPKNNPYKLIIERIPLLNSLKRLAVYCNKATQQIRFTINGSKLDIIAEDFEFANEAIETLTCCDYHGENIEIGFNVKFLTETITNIESEKIEIYLLDPTRAVIILPQQKKDNQQLLMLVMPLMIHNET